MSDVVQTAWYFHDVKWVVDEKLMIGTAPNKFGINEKVTNAMVMTILTRIDNEDLSAYNAGSYWYTQSMEWSKAVGLGVSTTSSVIQRQELAQIIVNYLKYKGLELPTTNVSFKDTQDISVASQEALSIMYNLELMVGIGDLQMNPTGELTRQELATVIRRVSDLIN